VAAVGCRYFRAAANNRAFTPSTTRSKEIRGDSSFTDDLGADSLDVVELVMALEEEFDCEIVDEDAENITTVQQAIDYINRLVAN